MVKIHCRFVLLAVVAVAVGWIGGNGETSEILFQHASAAPYDLSSAEFVAMTQNLVDGYMMTDMAFSTNGTKLFVLGYGYGVHQFSLAKAFDITTLSDREAAFPAAEGTGGIYTVGSMTFSADGTKLFLNGQPYLVKYELPAPYQLYNFSAISEGSTSGDFVSRSHDTTLYAGMALSADGTKMFLVNEQDSKIYEYSMDPAYNLTTARLTGHTVTVPDANPAALDFSADGTKMIVLGWEHHTAFQYTLGTGFDLSTAGSSPASNLTGIHRIDGATTGVQGVSFSSDGGKVFILTIKDASIDGNSGYYYKIYEYHLDVTPPVPTITTTATSPVSVDRIPITVDFGEPVTFDPTVGVSKTQGDIENIRVQNDNQTFTFDITNLADGTLEVSIPAGKTTDRAGNPNRASNTLTIAINLTAAVDPDDYFITTWRVTANDRTITIPVDGAAGTYTVHWGDGTSSADVSGDVSHTYESAGDYAVRISGDFTRIHSGSDSANAQKLKSIDQWGAIRWSSMESAFMDASNMIHNATDSPDLSGVSNMSSMFRGATSFNGNLSGWDVSSVVDMSDMFYYATSFNGDISSWDVSSVTDMERVFHQATSFNGDISNWDTSSVTDMSRLFYRAHAFNGDLSNWDTSSVTDMSGVFYYATSFNGDISSWDVSSVTYMYELFYYATSFNGDLSRWNTSSVTEMNDVFAVATSFNGDISNWDTSSVVDMRHMFIGATSFNGDISSWDVSSVTMMDDMFLFTDVFNQNLGPWYITLNSTHIHDGSYAASIVAQNSFLRGHYPSYSLVDGAGCANNANFTITGNILTINSAPTQDTYNICIGASGGSLFGTGNARQVTLSASITTQNANQQPVANAGANQTVAEGATVQLDGSASSDPDGDQLSYVWTAPSNIALQNSNTVAPSFTAPEVSADTDYTFTLAVSDGNATAADTVTITVQDASPLQTNSTLPAIPANLQATSTTNTVTLTWDDPADDTIECYKILSRATATQTKLTVLVADTGSAATSYTISNLNPNTNYAFRVIALNDNGESQISDYASISTKRTPPPAAPSNLQANSTTSTVTLTWDDPADDTTTGYKILSRATATQTKLTVLVNNTGNSATSYTISNLEPDTNYAFRVIALSNHGESQISGYASISTKRTPPPAVPSNLQAESTTSTVTLTWDDPGDSTITGYKILSRAHSQSELSVLVADTGSATNSYTISNLDPNTNYAFRIIALSDQGESQISHYVSISTKRLPPPAAPANLQAESTTSTVTLTWDDPGDSTITGYKILSRATATQTELSVLVNNTGSSATSYTISNLDPNTNYAFRIVAVSDHGESEVSDYVSISTKRLPPPAAPANLQANSTTSTVTLTWDDPSDSTITGYKILFRATATQTKLTMLVNNTGSSATSYTISNLDPNTNYAFRIAAVSDQGESQISHYVSISTLPSG